MDGDVLEKLRSTSQGRCHLLPLEVGVRTESWIPDSTCCISEIEVFGFFFLLAWCIKGNIILRNTQKCGLRWTWLLWHYLGGTWRSLHVILWMFFLFIWAMLFLKQRGLSVISSKDWNGVGERFRKRRFFFFKGLTKPALKSNGGGILELDAILVLLLHGREGRLELSKPCVLIC